MPKKILTDVCPIKLSETYRNIYELQYKLEINDEYLLATSENTSETNDRCENLQVLLRASHVARDNLITWSLKQHIVELQVMVSLLTAKIKLIEYKLNLCDGLDLHQACSLSLVNFCNILAELAHVKRNLSPTDKKTMHKVSVETNVPVWLSHYRNQICHVPSESPCISILVPLVVKSLDYMKESFWSRTIQQESFDEIKFKKLLSLISSLTEITIMNRQLRFRKLVEQSKRNIKKSELKLKQYSKACVALRKLIMRYPSQSTAELVEFIIQSECDDKSKNHALLLEQIIYARCFDLFLFKILTLVETNPHDTKALSWLQLLITLISLRKNENLRATLRKLELSASRKIKSYTDLSPIKCCHIVYRLINIDSPATRRLVVMMRHKILPILGKSRTLLLMKATRVMGFSKID